ncbi:ROK family protein [Alloscardovia venturai]|uniref:ROK family protein n=1 Tax=Alloscardovia venturai TaxID=1769421 RepID=A0ABW2Y2L7_9BIFI
MRWDEDFNSKQLIVDNRPSYIAVDIGGTKIASAIVAMTESAYMEDSGTDSEDFVGLPSSQILRKAASKADALTEAEHTAAVSCRVRKPTDALSGGPHVLRTVVKLIERQYERARNAGITIRGIGIGSAGVVDSERGIIISATDIMPGWAGQCVARALQESPVVGSVPVYMVGDVGAHGLGEALYGAGKGYESVLSLGIGTGIGGAYIERGTLKSGAHGAAGHAGHVSHGLGAGVLCSCGAYGHIEPVASGTGLATLYNLRKDKHTATALNGADVVERMMNGESFARTIVYESAKALGECIAGMANLIDPSIIVMSGSVVKAGQVWWDALREGFFSSALGPIQETKLVSGELGDDAPLIGAAYAVHAYISARKER